MQRSSLWKNILLLKHYQIRWQRYNTKVISKIVTPLFYIQIYNPFIFSKYQQTSSQTILVLTYPFSRAARASVLTNNYRYSLIKCLNQQKFRPQTCIRITFFPAAQVAAEEEVNKQILAVLKERTIKQNQFLGKSKPKKQQLYQHAQLQPLTHKLFPFNLQEWDTLRNNMPLLNQYQQLIFIHKGVKGNLSELQFSRAHWFISHHYILQNTLQCEKLKDDLLMFKKVLNKFNFFTFLKITELNKHNQKKYEALSRKVLKTFKWKRVESQNYLAFLLRTFGPQNMLTMLTDFEIVATQHTNMLSSQTN